MFFNRMMKKHEVYDQITLEKKVLEEHFISLWMDDNTSIINTFVFSSSDYISRYAVKRKRY